MGAPILKLSILTINKLGVNVLTMVPMESISPCIVTVFRVLLEWFLTLTITSCNPGFILAAGAVMA